MRRSLKAIVAASISISTMAAAGGSGTIVRDLPEPVSALVTRIVDCNHWQGEEPYDAERAAEIRKTVAKLECDRLAVDEQAILKKYGTDPAIKRAIDGAKDTYL